MLVLSVCGGGQCLSNSDRQQTAAIKCEKVTKESEIEDEIQSNTSYQYLQPFSIMSLSLAEKTAKEPQPLSTMSQALAEETARQPQLGRLMCDRPDPEQD